MHCCWVRQLVRDINEYSIALVDSNKGARKLTVDGEYRTVDAYHGKLIKVTKKTSDIPSGAAIIVLTVRLKILVVGAAFMSRSYRDCTRMDLVSMPECFLIDLWVSILLLVLNSLSEIV